MDRERRRRFIEQSWNDSILPVLIEYIRIPNKSPAFDLSWQANGYMETAVALIEQWCREHALPDMTVEVVRLEGRTPLLLMEVPGDGQDGVLLYGHLDKQPEMSGWRKELGPWRPVLAGDRLYGRGAGDDGYAVFAALSALRALADQGIWIGSPIGSALRASLSVWIPAAATTTSSGAPLPCAAWPPAC